MAVGPKDQIFVIYDQNSDVISCSVQDIMEATLLYDLSIVSMGLDNWCSSINRRHVKSDRIVFFVSMETEGLHEKLANNLNKYNHSRLLMLLTYKEERHSTSDNEGLEQYVESTIDIMKVLWKDCSYKDIRKIREIKYKDRSKGIVQSIEESWWPHFLLFLSGNSRCPDAELFFLIDPENEAEFKWYKEQKSFFEHEIGIRCSISYNDEVIEYIKTCKCVIIYVSASTVMTKELNDDQKDALELVRGLSRRLRMYVEKLNDSFIKLLTKRYELSKYGQGMMAHWLGLLYDLDLVRFRRRVDFMFYSPNAKYRNYRRFYGKVTESEHVAGETKENRSKKTRRNSRNVDNSRSSTRLASTSGPESRMNERFGAMSRKSASQSKGIGSRRPVMSPRVSITPDVKISENAGPSRLESVPETPDSLPISRQVSVASTVFENSQSVVELDSIDGLMVEDEFKERVDEIDGYDDVDGHVAARQTGVASSRLYRKDLDVADPEVSDVQPSQGMNQNRSVSIDIKTNTDLYEVNVASASQNKTGEIFQQEELTLPQTPSPQSYASLDSFGKACLKDYLLSTSNSSVQSQNYCTGRSLYNDEDNMEQFYKHLKHIDDAQAYKKAYLSRPVPLNHNRGTPMASLLFAQIRRKA